MTNDLKGIIIATLFACLLWELDERQTIKKIKKKKRLKEIEQQQIEQQEKK